MNKIAPFIPILGVILVFYYSIFTNKTTGIEDNGKIFYSSFIVQGISGVILIELLCKQ